MDLATAYVACCNSLNDPSMIGATIVVVESVSSVKIRYRR